MKLYREVKVSERNPEADKWVIAYDIEEEPYLARTSYSGVWYDMHDKATDSPHAWYEPYELPTEEEIMEAIRIAISDKMWTSRTIAKAITNLLKGERWG